MPPSISFLIFASVKHAAVFQGGVPSQDTCLHGNVDPRPIHVADLRVEIEKSGMNVRLGRAVLFDDGFSLCVYPLSSRQFDGNIVMLKSMTIRFLSRENVAESSLGTFDLSIYRGFPMIHRGIRVVDK